MDITNSQNRLFNVIDRSYQMGQKPWDDGVRLQNYTNLVNHNSYANYPHESYNQLDGNSSIGTFCKGNSQPSDLLNGVIKCNPRPNETASRFNYAFDKQIDKRMVDISGIEIPNNQLRVVPNRGVATLNQKTILPDNRNIQALAQRLTKISTTDVAENKNLFKFKASRQRLSRDELLGISREKFVPEPLPVSVIPP